MARLSLHRFKLTARTVLYEDGAQNQPEMELQIEAPYRPMEVPKRLSIQ